jgi:uncharacterized membrane-anchored protein
VAFTASGVCRSPLPGFGEVLAFWAAYIVTRPLGASLGDYLSQPKDVGGLNLGTGPTSFIFLGAILVLVAYLTRSKIDQTPPELIDHEVHMP